MEITHFEAMEHGLLVNLYQDSETMYFRLKYKYGFKMKLATWEREFRRFREAYPEKVEEKEFKADSGAIYKKFRKGE